MSLREGESNFSAVDVTRIFGQRETALPGFAVSEDATRLASTIRARHPESKAILCTGIAGEDGASTVAAQIALALALTDRDPVLLVDANIRTPSLHTLFRIPRSPGLAEVLQGAAGLQQTVRTTDIGLLSLLVVGDPIPNVGMLLGSSECPVLIRELGEKFRFVILNTAPILPYPDATSLVRGADGVVLVARVGYCRRPELVEAKRLLDAAKGMFIGVVLCDFD